MLCKIDMPDHFYSVKNIRNEGTVAEVVLELNPDHVVYRGHFPGMPVVPGVCTLMMVKECVERVTARKFTYRYIQSCKFLSSIRPDECRVLRLVLDCREPADDACILQAQVFAGERIMMKLKANLIVR